MNNFALIFQHYQNPIFVENFTKFVNKEISENNIVELTSIKKEIYIQSNEWLILMLCQPVQSYFMPRG